MKIHRQCEGTIISVFSKDTLTNVWSSPQKPEVSVGEMDLWGSGQFNRWREAAPSRRECSDPALACQRVESQLINLVLFSLPRACLPCTPGLNGIHSPVSCVAGLHVGHHTWLSLFSPDLTLSIRIFSTSLDFRSLWDS